MMVGDFVKFGRVRKEVLPSWMIFMNFGTAPKTGEVLPLQVDLEQQFGHLVHFLTEHN